MRLRLQGPATTIAAFMKRLPNALPPFARLDAMVETEAVMMSDDDPGDFEILPTEQ